jgi:hypothetical protein
MTTAGHFVGETYDTGDASPSVGRAATTLAEQGRSVRHLGALLSPDDELSLHLFEADSAETVAEVGLRADTPFDRIWPAVWIPQNRHEKGGAS